MYRPESDAAELQPLHGDEGDVAPRAQLRSTRRIVKGLVLVAAALFAVGICWPTKPAAPPPLDKDRAVYTAPAAFPTSDFPAMDYMPKGQEGVPRPVITKVRGGRYPDALVNPTQLPTAAPKSEGVLPLPSSQVPQKKQNSFRKDAMDKLTNLFTSGQSNCDKCLYALQYGQEIARAAPHLVPDMMVELCESFEYARSSSSVERGCKGTFGLAQWGGPYTQMLSYANLSVGSPTAAYLCAKYIKGKHCAMPPTPVLSDTFLHAWFGGQREAPASVAARSKKTGAPRAKPLRTLHISDFHVDPRYLVGSESNCDNGQCCRADSYNSTLWHEASFAPNAIPKANLSAPAGYWGSYHCDAPWSLIAAGMQGISGLIEADGPLDLGVFTGDLTTHDQHEHISRDLVMYSEQALFDMLHRHMGSAPLVPALGNHDYSPSDFAAMPGLPDGRSDQLSWNYENVAALVKAHGWGNDSTAEAIRKHYGGYSVSPRQGLRVISLNSDFWYKSNPMAYLRAEDPDVGGMLRWLTDELQAAEDQNERAWIVAHVLSGWDGGNGLEAPTNLFYQIVSRYEHTIAHIFFGHTHEDQFQLFYRGTNGDSSKASRKTKDANAFAFIGPSLTPLNNVQPALRIYEVDPETYEVMDYLQYYSPVDEFPHGAQHGPVWRLLYKARETYQDFSASVRAKKYAAPVALENGLWPRDAPLNASFWAAVTDEMEQRPALLELHHLYQSRKSPKSPKCGTAACHKAKLCYMRSGSGSLGRQCPKGYSSVQKDS